jgi:PEP-CTERM motif-containing protein
VPAFGTVTFAFSVDVPDVSGVLFTLREIPNGTARTVPEPGTLALIVIGVVGLAASVPWPILYGSR